MISRSGFSSSSPLCALCALCVLCVPFSAETAPAEPPRPFHVRLRVDNTAPGKPISPLIYGACNVGEEDIAAAGLTMLRWGGNHTTRYNWKLGNAWNAARDWKFQNGDYDLGHGPDVEAAHNRHAAMCKRLGVEFLLTVPTIGWVAKDWESASSKERGADPAETSVPAPPEFMAEWVRDLNEQRGLGVRWFAMDNEPDIWDHTHSDIHPEPAGYDEILERFLSYAAAVKQADPQARVTGPVSANVYYYFQLNSGAADKRAHGHKDFLPWFLGRVAEHDRVAGTRTLDALDVHYYPEFYAGHPHPGVPDDASRVAVTRELWDRGYVRPDGLRLELLPRLKRWIISEFSYGPADNACAALAHAEALGAFGREGVTYACRWDPTPAGSAVSTVYKLFRKPADDVRFGDLALPVTNTDPGRLSIFAARASAQDSTSGRITVVLVNRDLSAPAHGRLRLAAAVQAGNAATYTWTTALPTQLQPGTLAHDGAEAEFEVPAGSVTLVVF